MRRHRGSPVKQQHREIIMRKTLLALSTLALGMTSMAALADEGSFFVNGNVGQSHYPTAGSRYTSDFGIKEDRNDWAGALRVGYRWHSVVDYGVEAGYVDLGKRGSVLTDSTNMVNYKIDTKVRGWLLGGNLNYNITPQWFVSARAGWFRARTSVESNSTWLSNNYRWSSAFTHTGEYFGVGGGYNINRSFSVGLNYDHYRAPTGSPNPDIRSTKVHMYSLFGEYRF